ncbi:MAG TPA: RlmE family RNA methyltransferase [Myxococcota bacterium]|nr:RlmE family RNA methyltransferase [Myxococcota bacterium]
MTRYNPKDHYFEKAKILGFKARSVFKLEEIDQSLKLIKEDFVVLDLGCAPGSWLQYLGKKLGKNGAALGVDLSPVKEKIHPKIKTVVDDCFALSREKLDALMTDLVPNFTKFDVILSDMAPKTSGIKHVDQIRSLDLAHRALDLAEEFLKTGGHVVIKVFASKEASELVQRMKQLFTTVKQMRPKSVRAPSKEFYVVGMQKK